MAGNFVKELLVRFGIEPDEKSVHEAENSIDRLIDKAKDLGKEFLAFEGVMKFQEFIRGAAENAERLANTSLQLGVGVEQLQKLEFAAKTAGISTDELRQSASLLSRNLGEAAAGSKSAQEVFSKLGIALHDSGGRLKTFDTALPEIADKLEKIEDPALRVKTAMELFGRAGAKMVPFLAEGSEKLAALAAEADRFGAVMSEKDVKTAKEFNEKLEIMGAFVQGIKNTISTALIKSLTKVADATRKWMNENGPLIRSGLDKFFTGVGEALRIGAQLLDPFIEGLMAVGRTLSGLNPMLLAAAAAIGAIALVFGTAALAPVLFGAALALVVEDIYTFFVGGNSVTGIVVKKLDELWTAWTAPRAGEFFLVSAAKKAAIFIGHLFGDLLHDLSVVAGAILTGSWSDIPATLKALGSNLASNLGSFGNVSKNYDASKAAIENPNSAFGGGMTFSPEEVAAAGITSINAPFSPQITIHAQTGATADEIAGKVHGAITDFHDEHMRQTRAALVPAVR